MKFLTVGGFGTRPFAEWVAGATLCAFLLAGCGGGGGSAGGGGGGGPSQSALVDGTFVDSPVVGLGYRFTDPMDGQTTDGVTGPGGGFQYIAGEPITFYIGSPESPLYIGGGLAQGIMTPLDLFDPSSPDYAARVQDVVRILQSLDADGDPGTDIELPPVARGYAMTPAGQGLLTQRSLTSPIDVTPDLIALLQAAVGVSTFVDAAQAMSAFESTVTGIRTAGYVDPRGATPSTLVLSATPTSVAAGGFVDLNWYGTGVTLCVTSGDWSGPKDPTGSARVGPISVPAIYTLTCLGPGGVIERSVTVDILAPRCPLDASLELTDPRCVPCAYDPTIIASSPACVAPPSGLTKSVLPLAQELVAGSNGDSTVASALDRNRHVHIAWVERDAQNNKELHYARFTGQQFVDQINLTAGSSFSGMKDVDITVDGTNRPHVAFFVRRTSSGSTNTGEFAVIYATLTGTGWLVSQVSTNPANPAANTGDIYNCDVNYVAPRVSINGAGEAVVTYRSRSSSANNFTNKLVSARRQAGAWSRAELFDHNFAPGEPAGIAGYDVAESGDPTVGPYVSRTIGLTESPFWRIRQGGQWSRLTLGGFSTSGEIKNPQVDVDGMGRQLFTFWYRPTTNENSIVTASINTSPIATSQVPLPNGVAGNFLPAAVDTVTDRRYFVYQGTFGGVSNVVLLKDEDGNGAYEPLEMGAIHVVQGRDSLNAYGNVVTWVGGSENRNEIAVQTLLIDGVP